MNPTKVTTEERLLRVIQKLVEMSILETSLSIANFDASLRGWGPLLGRLTGGEFRK